MSIIGCTSSGFKGEIAWTVKFDLAISASYPSFLIQPHLPALLPITHHIKGNPHVSSSDWAAMYTIPARHSFRKLHKTLKILKLRPDCLSDGELRKLK